VSYLLPAGSFSEATPIVANVFLGKYGGREGGRKGGREGGRIESYLLPAGSFSEATPIVANVCLGEEGGRMGGREGKGVPRFEKSMFTFSFTLPPSLPPSLPSSRHAPPPFLLPHDRHLHAHRRLWLHHPRLRGTSLPSLLPSLPPSPFLPIILSHSFLPSLPPSLPPSLGPRSRPHAGSSSLCQDRQARLRPPHALRLLPNWSVRCVVVPPSLPPSLRPSLPPSLSSSRPISFFLSA